MQIKHMSSLDHCLLLSLFVSTRLNPKWEFEISCATHCRILSRDIRLNFYEFFILRHDTFCARLVADSRKSDGVMSKWFLSQFVHDIILVFFSFSEEFTIFHHAISRGFKSLCARIRLHNMLCKHWTVCWTVCMTQISYYPLPTFKSCFEKCIEPLIFKFSHFDFLLLKN